MDSNASFHSKMSKVENLLSIVNNEVDSTIKLLNYFKQHSFEMVEALKKVPSPSVFLKEFLEINSLLLKYLDFLTEINCKFEILQASEKEGKSMVNLTDQTTSTLNSSKSDLDVNFKHSSATSAVLPLDYLSDCSSLQSSNTSCGEKITEKNIQAEMVKSKKTKKKRKDTESRARDSALDDKLFDKGKDIRNEEDSFIYSVSETESENLRQELLTSCTPVKEPTKKFDLEKQPETSSDSVSMRQLEGCNDKLFEIKPANVSRKLGEEYKVVVERIISPSEFYVYIINNSLNSFMELENKLKMIEKETRKNDSKEHISQVMGKYALYYSKCDEKWCRAKVTDWRLNQKDDLVYIFLIDYGESKCVTLNDIQSMPDSLKLYPAFIQRCHLSGIRPAEVNSNNKTLAWSKAATEKMKCLVDTSKSFKIKIAPEDTYHPAKSLPVTLWLLDQGETCVNDSLVKSQRAKPVSEAESISESLEKWNPMKEDFDSYLNTYDLDVNDPAAFIYGYVGKDYDRICRQFAKTGKCFKGQSCKKEHVPLNPLGFTTDQEEVYKNAVNALPLPPPKSIISVQVTCILSLNLFCCIRDDSAWTSEEETLKSLVHYMNTNENIREMKKLLIPPSVGQLVIAKYSLDESWYRGRILESQPESDQYSVLFVDYGNKEEMSLSSIRAIEGRYLHLPFQALECYIFGLTQNPKMPFKECMDYLNKRMTEGCINIEVVATYPGDHPRLLVHVFDENGKNIGKELIEKEYAVIKEELLVNKESTSIPG